MEASAPSNVNVIRPLPLTHTWYVHVLRPHRLIELRELTPQAASVRRLYSRFASSGEVRLQALVHEALNHSASV